MGNGRWSSTDWQNYAARNVSGKSRTEVFTRRSLDDAVNPARIAMRESRDSADNPQSTPIILAADVTGSMGMVAHKLMQDGLNTLATEIYARKPVTDPHVMAMAVGDACCDQAPLQVTQFEADIRLADQVRNLWLEGGGGGNGGETYMSAHLFAATKTAADAFEKRGRKGYLFTIGDEPVLDGLTREQAARVMGIEIPRDLSSHEILTMAQRNWEVFHIILSNEGYARARPDAVLRSWKALLPERTIQLGDVDRLAETVVSAIQINEGARPQDVTASWSGSTALVVAEAIRGMAPVPARRGLRRLFG